MNSKVILIDKNLPAYYAAPETKGKHPGIVLVHEAWGLTPHIRDVANRLVAAGYVVIAPNLFHETEFDAKLEPEILGELSDPQKCVDAQKRMRDALVPVKTPDFVRDTVKKLGHAFHHLSKDELASEEAIGAMGFGLGGNYVFTFATKEPRLKAAVIFYGDAPEPLEKIATIVCPVLAFYGEKDPEHMEELPALQDTMKQYEKTFEVVTHPDAGRGFFNDTNASVHHPDAAETSWHKTLSFLERNLVRG